MALDRKTVAYLKKIAAPDLTQKTVLVTGATSGIGLKTAEIALYLHARVLLACRNLQKAEAVKRAFLCEYPQSDIDILPLDIASLDSVRGFAGLLKTKDVDVFVNNAGVFHHPSETTQDGFELIMGTNYLGTYALSEAVLPYLTSLPHTVTYIHTVSLAHKYAKIDYGNFYGEKRYGNFSVYAASKLCLVKYSLHLAEKYKDTNVRVQMTHPGIAITNIAFSAFGDTLASLQKAFSFLFNSTEQSATSFAYVLAKNPPVGSLVGPNRFCDGWGWPTLNRQKKHLTDGTAELLAFTENEIKKRDVAASQSSSNSSSSSSSSSSGNGSSSVKSPSSNIFSTSSSASL